uniref:Uncharacterized protein n=1 Tax=Arundo donax TaxID=35708 RepID=A0A0A9C7T1_ARUDO
MQKSKSSLSARGHFILTSQS